VHDREEDGGDGDDDGAESGFVCVGGGGVQGCGCGWVGGVRI
jgi:hypothetical protein